MIHHGGKLEWLRREFPDAPEPLIDLSTGINPFPYPFPAIPETAYSRLPEEGQIKRLKEAAADAYGCSDPSYIAVAPGTQILISLLPRILPARQVAILSPTYGEHAAAWASAGADVTTCADMTGFSADGTNVLCNPNNPDGRWFDADRIIAKQRACAEQGGRIVVDEAFAEFAEGRLSVVPHIPQAGLIVLRSFGKAFGLAGLRLGFLISDREIVNRIEDGLGPWPISGISIHIATVALRDAAWRQQMSERLAGDVRRLDQLLSAKGFACLGGTSLFRLVRHEDAGRIARELGAAGILIRTFPEQEKWLRFGIPPDEAAWLRLEAALKA